MVQVPQNWVIFFIYKTVTPDQYVTFKLPYTRTDLMKTVKSLWWFDLALGVTWCLYTLWDPGQDIGSLFYLIFGTTNFLKTARFPTRPWVRSPTFLLHIYKLTRHTFEVLQDWLISSLYNGYSHTSYKMKCHANSFTSQAQGVKNFIMWLPQPHEVSFIRQHKHHQTWLYGKTTCLWS